MPAERIFNWCCTWCLVACCFCGCWVATSQKLPATPPENWEVIRVFINDDPEQISRLVSSHYATVLIDDLARKLAEHSNQRKVFPLQTAGLEEAIYVARLEGNNLVSDQSRWKFAGANQPEQVELGKLSLALRSARGVPPTELQLPDYVQFSSVGAIEMPVQAEGSTYWFGWSQTSRGRESQRVFDCSLPPAPAATLLIAAPADVELASPTVVTQKIGAVSDHLPQDWPSGNLATTATSLQWWSVHLSGTSNFQLIASHRHGQQLTRYAHLVRTATWEYVGGEQSLRSQARFEVHGYQSSNPLRLALSPELKLARVLIDGVSVRWRVEPNPAPEPSPAQLSEQEPAQLSEQEPAAGDGSVFQQFLISLPDHKNLPREFQLEVQALSSLSVARPVTLPTINLVDAYVLDGTCRLWASPGWVADALIAAGSRGQRLPRQSSLGSSPSLAEANDESQVDNGLMWETKWLGNPPELTASFSRQRQPSTARSLTRFTIQAEWLAATCRLRIEAPGLNSNELRLPVGNGWFIDSVRLLDGAGDIRPRVEDRVGATSPVIVIDWEEKREQLSLELEVRAHSPRDLRAETISLRSPRLVTVPQSDQIDNYVIEPSSRFAVQMDARLLPYQRLPFELPQWQQELLQASGAGAIFQGIRGSIPPITLAAARGTFTSRLLTVAAPARLTQPDVQAGSARASAGSAAMAQFDEQLVVVSQITCIPQSGSMDRLSLTLPPLSVATDWSWTLEQPDENDERLLLQVAATALASQDSDNSTPQPTIVDLELPNPVSTPFTLTSRMVLPLDRSAQHSIPVVGVLAATDAESTLLIPRELAAGLDELSAELTATTLRDPREKLALEKLELGAMLDTEWVSARLEASSSHGLDVSLPKSNLSHGWVWTEELWHILEDNGQLVHEAHWIIEGTRLEPLRIELPAHWYVQQLAIDGQPVNGLSPDRQLQVELPRHGRTSLSLRCGSRQTSTQWLNYVGCERPQLSLPLLASRRALVISPSLVALRQLLGPAMSVNSAVATDPASARLVDRLLPQSLWAWLVPTRDSTVGPLKEQGPSVEDGSSVMERLPSGWSVVDLSSLVSPTKHEADIATTSGTTTGTERESAEVAAEGEWVFSRTALSALAVAVVLMLACGFWFVLGSSPRLWWMAATLTAIAVVLVPAWLLPLAQLVLLSIGVASLLRLSGVVHYWRKTNPQPRGRSSVIHPAAQSTTGVILALCVLSASASAQMPATSTPLPFSPGAAESVAATTAAEPGAVPPKIFSVLIPLDDQGQVAGAYAYAPTRLLEILAGGSEVAIRQATPKILSAEYLVRMRRGLSGGPDQVQELSVEFRLQVSQAETEIRFPFSAGQLLLQRGSVAGQELFVGGRWLYQLPDAVVFRPSSTGVVRLKLSFEPRELSLSETQGSLRCSIPPIATANLRIMADSPSVFEIGAAGSGRKTITSASTELLGPAAELELRWSPVVQRTTPGQLPAEVFADTWLHVRGSQVTAICQLRIENPRALPQELTVIAEAGWDPVGTDWQDANLISQQSLGGRRVYGLRCNDDWNRAAPLVLRTALVPRNTEPGNLAIPFFSLREVSQTTRTLAWSSDSEARWRPDGLDLWQELTAVPGLDWGDLGWPQRPQLYRVLGSLATGLRPTLPVDSPTVDELTQVHVGDGETQLDYRAQFSVPQARPVTLLIPAATRVDALQVDGQNVDYRLSERGPQAWLEILPGSSPLTIKNLELTLSHLQPLGRVSRFPRITVRDFGAQRSIYQVLSEVGVDCEVLPSDELSLGESLIPPHELLPALETLLGQVDLQDAYRSTPALPLEYTVRRREQPRLVGAIMTLQPTEQSWRAMVRAEWETGDRPLEFAFFELPLSVRDSLDAGPLPAQLTPLGESGRLTLRIIPAPPVAGVTRVEFSFVLPPAVSKQTLTLPAVAVIAEQPVRPIVALPKFIDSQAVLWSPPGQRMDEPPGSLLDQDWQTRFDFFEVDAARAQVSWKRFKAQADAAQSWLTRFTLLRQQGDQIAGFADYWLLPQGQSKLLISVPDQCQVLGVELGSGPAVWSAAKSQLEVLLSPNYLPVNVRVLLRWQLASADTLSLALPRLQNAQSTQRTLEFVENRIPQVRSLNHAASRAQQGIAQAFAAQWTQLLFDTLQAGRTRPPRELDAWLQNWQPALVGLNGGAAVDAEAAARIMQLFDEVGSSDPANLSLDELWNEVRQLMQLAAAESDSSAAPDGSAGLDDAVVAAAAIVAEPDRRSTPLVASVLVGSSQYLRLESEQDTLVLQAAPASAPWSAQWLAAGLLAAASLLVLWLARRLGPSYMKLLATQPWLYWLQLAGVAWCLLPVAWPSWLLAATACCMLLSQWFDSRRRQRLLARV